MRRALRWLGLAVVLWATAARPLRAGENPAAMMAKFQAMFKEGEPTFTAAEAEAAAREARPLVEAVTGRKLRKLPKVVIADRPTVAASLAKDLLPQLRKIGPKQTEWQVRLMAAQQSTVMAMCLLGKYGFEDKTLYMLPRNFEPLLRLIKIDAKHSPAVLKLIVAHELTHALQDQELGLRKLLAAASDLDGLQAANAVVEGQAVLVQDLVGKRLGLDDAVLHSSRLFSAGAVKIDDPALAVIAKVIDSQFEQIYLGGRAFVAHHHRAGGMARVWHILAHPPADTSVIARPATYGQPRKAGPDLAGVMAGLEADFGKLPWKTQNLKVGTMLLRSAYANMAPKDRDRLVAQVSHAQTLVAQCAAPFRMADASILVLTDPAFAPTYVRILEQTARAFTAKMKGSTLLTAQNLHVGRFAGAPKTATASSKLWFDIKLPDGQLQRHTFVRVGLGDVLIEIHEVDLALTDAAVAAIVGKIYSRYQTAKLDLRRDE